ncbi:MAG TPA: hypothetical protein VGE67_14080 [Haloferula sp.]
MKLGRVVILSSLLAGFIPSAVAQDLLPALDDLPPPLDLPPPVEDGVINRVNPRSSSTPKSTAPPQLIGEGGGTRLLHYCKANPISSARSFFHQLVAETADGRQFLLYHDESRAPEPVARVNDRGDVATVLRWSCVGAFFAPDYKPVNIRKLRSDRFLKATPRFEHFTIRDIAWGDGVLVCSGHLCIASNEYPFLSRLLFNEKGEVSDHQILWTTWKPGSSVGATNPAANSISRSLHQQGNLVLWKNAGQNKQSDSQGFAKSTWQCTELETGTTRPLAEADPVDRDRLAKIEQEIEKAQPSRKPRS